MKSAYELAMERLEKKEPTKKLTEKQKARIAEINSLYGSKIAEKETFLQGEIMKEKAKGDTDRRGPNSGSTCARSAAAACRVGGKKGRRPWRADRIRERNRAHREEAPPKSKPARMDIATQKEKTLDRLARTLDEYFDAVPRQKEPNPPDLLAIFARLDVFEKEIDAPIRLSFGITCIQKLPQSPPLPSGSGLRKRQRQLLSLAFP